MEIDLGAIANKDNVAGLIRSFETSAIPSLAKAAQAGVTPPTSALPPSARRALLRAQMIVQILSVPYSQMHSASLLANKDKDRS